VRKGYILTMASATTTITEQMQTQTHESENDKHLSNQPNRLSPDRELAASLPMWSFPSTTATERLPADQSSPLPVGSRSRRSPNRFHFSDQLTKAHPTMQRLLSRKRKLPLQSPSPQASVIDLVEESPPLRCQTRTPTPPPSNSLVQQVETPTSFSLWDNIAWQGPTCKQHPQKSNRKKQIIPQSLDFDVGTLPTAPKFHKPNCPQFQIWQRLQKFPFSTTPTNEQDVSSSLQVISSMVRVRLAAGMVKSTFQLLQDQLSRGYKQAKSFQGEDILEVDGESCQDQSSALTQRLSGLWCIYAHIVLQVGHMGLLQQQQQQQQQQPPAQDDTIRATATTTTCVTFQDILAHTIQILLTAGSCPLVGTHPWIVVALGRLILAGNVLQQQDASPSESSTSSSTSTSTRTSTRIVTLDGVEFQSCVRQAIHACWDAMDRCRDLDLDQTPRFAPPERDSVERSAYFLSHLQRQQGPIGNESSARITCKDLEYSFHKTIDLPMTLEATCDDLPLVSNAPAIRALCGELNRYSRLEERLQTRPLVPVTASKEADGCCFLDSLVLFRNVNISTQQVFPNAQNDPYSYCLEISHACKKCRAHYANEEERNLHETHACSDNGSSEAFQNTRSIVLWTW
jgi:hypothetical protein